jgi:hypothetical protein
MRDIVPVLILIFIYWTVLPVRYCWFQGSQNNSGNNLRVLVYFP